MITATQSRRNSEPPTVATCLPKKQSTRGRLVKLEAIRGFAAAYVILHHAHLTERPVAGIFLSFGQEAVILFFLLSGFVIYYASLRGTGMLRFGTYFMHRFRRIWPTFLISLALAYVAYSVGASQCGGWRQLLGNLAMLQDVSALKRGVWVDTYGGNTPLWSLSYEWWFYMMFYPIVSQSRFSPRRQMVLAFTLSVLGFLSYQAIPNQVSLFAGYFFIWWTGVELSREYIASGTITWSHQRLLLLMLAGLVVLWSLPVGLAASRSGGLRFGVDPVLQFRHFALALVFSVVGIAWYRAGFVGFRMLVGPFAVLAPISYALYAMHMPVMQILDAAGAKFPGVRLALTCMVLIPMCYLVEVVLQRRVNGWLDRLSVPSKRRRGGARQ